MIDLGPFRRCILVQEHGKELFDLVKSRKEKEYSTAMLHTAAA